ncbi:MAG: DUF4236 domain-containing protein [Leptospiraceae bacterium]|nr:DUF4236 domain-containing protein [Leptospiraceae bacterium]
MGLRYSKRIKLFPGAKMNLSKSGVGFSFGGRGASLSTGSKGTYANFGLPGTGLSYRAKISPSTKQIKLTNELRILKEMTAKGLAFRINDNDSIELHYKDGSEIPSGHIALLKKWDPTFYKRYVPMLVEEHNSIFDELLNVYKFNSNGQRENIRPAEYSFFYKTFISTYSESLKDFHQVVSFFQRHMLSFKKTFAVSRTIHSFHYPNSIISKVDKDWMHTINKSHINIMHILLKINWPKETLISYDWTEENELLIDVDLPEIEMLPSKRLEVTVDGNRIKSKKLSENEIQSLYRKHIFGIIFRTIGELFRHISFLQSIKIYGFTQRADASTGNINDTYIICSYIKAEEWNTLNKLNLESIDPESALSRFTLITDISKKGYFSEINISE